MSQAFQALKSSAVDSQSQAVGIRRRTEAAVRAKMTFSRLLSRAVLINRAGSRSAFTSSKRDTANPNWLQVGLAFGTSAFIWGLLFKQHSTDVHEYEVKKGLQ
ncbi:NADH dehydrogenase [ubiquinone] 1 subunit C1, mitochondrial [Gambusia affinis]|uniref:NADH dehydrogenase [ubiquinone] 1 subunit C1, mitochondrial n=1 Tax=Gambusia affinis TaxID=33528 RepID=UPI001CDD0C64|nr:NADH dehydrogenase [ubiquinone] 1 subunit C1, mitochondrial [Gambusia affinis]XP_043982119.1 NADH dehydrogenase [ubiquinone] 1 subunit C1, mitochondrial [Gambusia affinis]